MQSDLAVRSISSSLKNRHIDVVVTGSIGAVESVRFIRQMRRLGASVQAWMSHGARQFTTETALAWASGRSVRTDFSGEFSHISEADACVIAPASASFIGKLTHGITDSHTTALCLSAIGKCIPTLMIPNMHDSLLSSPSIGANIDKLAKYVNVIEGRVEEGKHKFPNPHHLADKVAHIINSTIVKNKLPQVMITMGSTRGYIDQVRYVSNYSSGALGSEIASECYRRGWKTDVIVGPCPIKPQSYSSITEVETNEMLEKACREKLDPNSGVAIMAASVLDFIPSQTLNGKVSSKSDLTVSFIKTPKIISQVRSNTGIKIGFKLEAELDAEKTRRIAADYISRYQLSAIVINKLQDVDSKRHKATFVEVSGPDIQYTNLTSKAEIAAAICDHIQDRYHPAPLQES